MMPAGEPVISEEELNEALDDAAAGGYKIGLQVNDAIIAVLERVMRNGEVHAQDEYEAMKLRQEMEDAENIAEANSL